ncbi:ATP-binding protein [Bacillus xiapuensis]|uniref:ATP-binding protein n=1 Tax=Bacillus xiapuensis TaxID=2014075 RepID=UPI001E35059E|nr:ATP-binding protein [Bacillus xiapuensis]
MIAISAVYFITVIIAHPLIGLRVIPISENKCVVTEVYSQGWASYKNINKETLVDCQTVSNTPFKLEKLDQIVRHYNKREIVTYKGMPISYLIYSFVPIIYFILCFLIALYLFFKKSSNYRSILSSYLLLLVSLAYLASGVSARADWFGMFITLISLYLIPILLLKYLRIMITKKPRRLSAKYRLLLYGLLFIIALINTLIGAAKFALMPFILLSLAVLLYFISQFWAIKQSIHFVKVRFFIWTIIFSLLPFILLSAITEVLFGTQLIAAENTAFFLLFIPLSFVYVNVQKVFFDFDLFIKRLLVNILISLLPASALSGMIYLKEGYSIFVFQVFLAAIVLMTAFLFLKDFIATYLLQNERKFHASLAKFSQVSSQIHDRQTLFSYLNRLVSAVLQVDDVKAVHYDINHQPQENGQCSGQPLVKEPFSIGDLLELSDGYALAVSKSNGACTFLTFSYKQKTTQLNKEEKHWLKSIAHYTNILLENLKKTEDLVAEIEEMRDGGVSSTISRTLLLIGEKERVKLAQDIHDSILQELIFICKNIEIIQNQQGERTHALEDIKLQLSEQIDFIRETCYELNPFFLKEIGLIDSLTALLDKYRKSCGFEVDFQVSHAKFFMNIDEDMALILYRIVQELMNNAKKHSKANFIYVSLSYRQNHYVLVYEDDGVGFDLNQGPHQKHFGMIGLNERIRSLHGEWTIHTEPFQGLLLRATIPSQRNDAND